MSVTRIVFVKATPSLLHTAQSNVRRKLLPDFTKLLFIGSYISCTSALDNRCTVMCALMSSGTAANAPTISVHDSSTQFSLALPTTNSLIVRSDAAGMELNTFDCLLPSASSQYRRRQFSLASHFAIRDSSSRFF